MTKVRKRVELKSSLLPFETIHKQLKDLKKYLPWPNSAVTAYSVFSYTEQVDQSLVQYLRDQLGQWWSDKMHCIKGGMYQLPEAFTKRNRYGWNEDVWLQKKIKLNHTVKEIKYTFDWGRTFQKLCKSYGLRRNQNAAYVRWRRCFSHSSNQHSQTNYVLSHS